MRFRDRELEGGNREVLMSQSGQGWLNTTVTLSTDRQQFAFARIGAVPAHCDTGTALVIVPQFDDVSGAHRIASAFSLNWAEEKIITRILQGQCPRDRGRARLTEATVRTYTKRIMLKLGINGSPSSFCSIISPCHLLAQAARKVGGPALLRGQIERRG